MNKKGISQLIAVVIFILMAALSVVFLAGSVNNFIKDSGAKLAPAFSCPDLQANPSRIVSSSYSGNGLEVKVKRSNLDVKSLTFVLDSESKSRSFVCETNPSQCGTCILQGLGQEKTFTFNLENIENVKIYANGNCLMHERAVS